MIILNAGNPNHNLKHPLVDDNINKSTTLKQHRSLYDKEHDTASKFPVLFIQYISGHDVQWY